MLEVFGQGLLLEAKSGVGKSDLALALVDRGHCLVADDLVEFSAQGDVLIARCRSGLEGFLEVRGLGVVNLDQLYGKGAIKPRAVVNLVLLLDAGADDAYDNLGPRQQQWQLQGVTVPAWHLPYSAQRNMALIVETAVRLNLARQQGYDAGSDLQARLAGLMKQGVA